MLEVPSGGSRLMAMTLAVLAVGYSEFAVEDVE